MASNLIQLSTGMPEENIYSSLIDKCRQILIKMSNEYKFPDGHDYMHFNTVYKHTHFALLTATLSKESGVKVMTGIECFATQLAALLHDLDDRKLKRLFQLTDEETKAKYPITDRVLIELAKLDPDSKNEAKWTQISTLVFEMIGYVSCSQNGNAVPAGVPLWKMIPRDADRLEAIGMIGIKRCFEYTHQIGNSLVCPTTPLPTTRRELDTVIAKYNLDDYVKSGGKSESMLDHFYQKLFHIGIMASDNEYLQGLADEAISAMKLWIVKLNRQLKIADVRALISTHDFIHMAEFK